MGYFSNGTEGAIYEEHFCKRCIHFGPEEGPGSLNGNAQCAMFALAEAGLE